MRTLVVLFVLAAAAWPQTMREKEPGKGPKGKPFAWTTKGGLRYYYRVPKSYTRSRGADLTVYVIESLSESATVFPGYDLFKHVIDDVVVFPVCGLDAKTDTPDPLVAEQVHLLIEGFRRTFKVNAVCVGGDGTGASFALDLMRHYPADLNGVFANVPHPWPTIKPPQDGPRPAVYLHGYSLWRWTEPGELSTQDNLGSTLEILRRFDANGWPRLAFSASHRAQHRAQWIGLQGITWCKAIGSDDPKRLCRAYETFSVNMTPRARDLASLYALCDAIVAADGVPPIPRRRAGQCRAAIERLAEDHVRAIHEALGTSDGEEFEERGWVGHVRCFLWGFRGVPARDKFEGEWRARLRQHDERAAPRLERYLKLRETDRAAAFKALVEALRAAPLAEACHHDPALWTLYDWGRHFATEYGLDKADVRFALRFLSARDEGLRAYGSLNQSFRLP